MAAATDREREIDMRMNDKLSIGTGRDREAAPDIRTEVRTDTIRAYLKKKLRSDQILSDKIDGKYLSDAMGRRKGAAALVVFPESAAEVSFIMRSAWENELPVTPLGAGTNLTGATVPDGGIVLDLSRMNRILEFDPDTFTATVEPGVLLADFQSYVEEKGYFYPPDPGEKQSTIGGNISTNAGGMRAVKYGVTRDYVMGLELVKADGTVITVGSRNRKDSSGLNLTNLLIGSEGTLAVITKCILRLLPKPEYSVSALVPFRTLREGIASVHTLSASGTAPTAVEFVEKDVVRLGEEFTGEKFPPCDAACYLILTFDGSRTGVEEDLKKAETVLRRSGASGFLVLDEAELAKRVWKIRGALVKAVEAVSIQEPVDVVVPIDRIEEFVTFCSGLQKETGIGMVSFGHAGDGNVHLCVVRGDIPQERWETELSAVLARIYSKAEELGGLISGEHGIGLAKKRYFEHASSPEVLELMRMIKQSFDGKGILNPGKSYLES